MALSRGTGKHFITSASKSTLWPPGATAARTRSPANAFCQMAGADCGSGIAVSSQARFPRGIRSTEASRVVSLGVTVVHQLSSRRRANEQRHSFFLTLRQQRNVGSFPIETDIGPSEVEGNVGEVELNPSVLPGSRDLPQKLSGILTVQSSALFQYLSAPREIDGAAIVRIDHAEVPQFAALIEIGQARRGDFPQRLGERVEGRVFRCGARAP